MTAQLALRHQLRDFLTEAQRRNSGYSLRGMATKLQISASSLSEILKGKRKVSQDLAQKILSNLGTDPIQQSKILSLFNESSNGAIAQGTLDEGTLELTADQFHVIGDWFHFAILSLAETKGFVGDPLWVAKRLGIKLTEAESALARLQRLGLIQWSRSKKTVKLLKNQLKTTDEVRDQAIRRSHQQDIEIVNKALAETPLEKRDFTSMTLAINVKKMAEAKKVIRDFQEKMSAFLETGTKTEVYKLCVQLIPLSKEAL